MGKEGERQAEEKYPQTEANTEPPEKIKPYTPSERRTGALLAIAVVWIAGIGGAMYNFAYNALALNNPFIGFAECLLLSLAIWHYTQPWEEIKQEEI